MRRQTIALAGAGLALALGGCAHNDVLVFGTDTKVAIDVETAATQGGSPSITIGYKRKEAVWMPLLVNAKDSKIVPCEKDSHGACTPGSGGPWTAEDAKYKSTDTTSQNGKTETRSDAYSVFASIGADIKGGATAETDANGKPKTGATAGVGVAQFFATGIAAINLTNNPALVTALKVESSQGAEAQSKAVQSVATGGYQTWFASLPADVQKTLQDREATRKTAETANIATLKSCATGADGNWRWPNVMSKTTSDETYAYLKDTDLNKATTFDGVSAFIAGSAPLQERLIADCKELGYVN